MDDQQVDQILGGAEQLLHEINENPVGLPPPQPDQTAQLRPLIQQEVQRALAQLAQNISVMRGPKGLPGADGKSVDEAEVLQFVRKEVSRIPKPKDGKDGKDGRDGKLREIRTQIRVPENRASAVDFVPSGTGAQTSTVSEALQLYVHTSQYDTQGNYETTRDALTGTTGVNNLDVSGTLAVTGGGSLLGTWSDLGTVTTVDINGGTIDGVTIGGSSAAAGTFTSITNSGLTSGHIPYASTSGLLADSTNLQWDSANNQLLLGNGSAAAPAYSFSSNPDLGFVHVASSLLLTIDGTYKYLWQTANLRLASDIALGWSSNTDASAAVADTILVRDAANILAQRNGTSAQVFNHYGTFTSTSSYQRSALKHAKTTLSNVSGATVTATNLIPDGAFLFGVTTRVNTGLGTGNGTTGYAVGDSGDPNKWGDVVGTAAGTASGSADFTVTTAAALYTSADSVILTAAGGNFDGTGDIEVIAHYMITEAD